jgi:hypothetical protein
MDTKQRLASASSYQRYICPVAEQVKAHDQPFRLENTGILGSSSHWTYVMNGLFKPFHKPLACKF